MKSNFIRAVLCLGVLSAAPFASAQYRGHHGGWTYCASEGPGAVCNVSGPVTIRFGVNGRYTYMDANSPVPCNWRVMGDPAANVPGKVCEFRPAQRQIVGHVTSQFCASEGQACNVPRGTVVSYGANGVYATRVINGGRVECNNSTFGDPLPGTVKACYIGRVAVNQPHNVQPRWVFCAQEGQYCNPPGRRGSRVRFGQNGKNGAPAQFVEQIIRGDGVMCDLNNFLDPMRGTRKVCQYLER